MKILSRKDAMSLGSKTYFTGDACSNGHTTVRYTKGGMCKGCIKMYRDRDAIRVNMALAGTPIFAMRVHADDHAAVAAYVQALYMQRGMTPPAAPDAPPAAQPQPTRWQLWSRTYGAERALEMIRSQPPYSPEEQVLLSDER